MIGREGSGLTWCVTLAPRMMALYAGSKRKEGNERHKGFCKARENRVFSSVCIAVSKNGILRVLD